MNGIPETFNGKSLIHAWTYKDSKGDALGIVARYQNGTDKKEIIPFFRRNGSSWAAGVELNPRPLFGLELLASPMKPKAILIVEGEKSAAPLQTIGIAALTSLGGPQAAKQADWTPLNNYKTVYLLPDNDEPGRKYMKDVYAALMALETPPEVKFLQLPGLPDKGDVVDWLQNYAPDWDGYRPIPEELHELLKEKLRAEIKKAVPIPENWSLRAKKPLKAEQKKEKIIKIVTINELLRYVFPVREAILSPVFTLGSINMIFSARGVGKTHMGLGLAYTSACGTSFWGWKASRAFKTLYIDGEMPGEALQARLAEIVQGAESEPLPENLKIITIDLNDGQMPDLSNLEGQIEIEAACNDAELIIVDNLSCLARSGRENEAESWGSIAEWALRMRSAGKCVIFMHHAGKNGAQRGTSKREDLLDVVIELKRPADYDSDQGARFIVNFSKARHLTGNEAQSFEAWLQKDADGKPIWTTKPAVESTYDQVVEMANLGMTQADISRELEVNKSTVCRHWNKAEDRGDIKEKPIRTP